MYEWYPLPRKSRGFVPVAVVPVDRRTSIKEKTRANKSVATSSEEARGRREEAATATRNFCRRAYPRVVEGQSGPFGGAKGTKRQASDEPGKAAMRTLCSRPVARSLGEADRTRARRQSDTSLSKSFLRFSATLNPRHPVRRFDARRKLAVEIFSFSTQTGASPLPLRSPGCSVRQTPGLPRVQVKR